MGDGVFVLLSKDGRIRHTSYYRRMVIIGMKAKMTNRKRGLRYYAHHLGRGTGGGDKAALPRWLVAKLYAILILFNAVIHSTMLLCPRYAIHPTRRVRTPGLSRRRP